MYIPSHFTIYDEAMINKIVKEHSFATLFSTHDGMPVATHLPLLLDEERHCLYGHFARANPQWKEIKGQTVLAVFQGPHCYISPSWYETGKAVPTWNYVTVHVYGEAALVEEQDELADSLQKMVSTYEAPGSPYRLEDVDPSFLMNMSKGIQGFTIKINKLEGKAKLSQNHPVDRQKRVINELKKSPREDDQRIALLMQENLKKR